MSDVERGRTNRIWILAKPPIFCMPSQAYIGIMNSISIATNIYRHQVHTMVQNLATKHSLLACRAMYNLAQERRRAEQTAKVDDLLHHLGGHENADRIQELAQIEAEFHKRVETTTKVLKAKQALWRAHSSLESTHEWMVNQHQRQPEDMSWEAEISGSCRLHQSHGLVSNDAVKSTDCDGYEMQPDDDNESSNGNHGCTYDSEKECRALAMPTTTTGKSSPSLEEQHHLDSDSQQRDAEWALPAWCLGDEPPPSLPDGKTLDQFVYSNDTTTARTPESTAESHLKKSHASNQAGPDATDARRYTHPAHEGEGALSEHLRLAKLLLDKEWHEFVGIWAVRNDKVRQVELHRGHAWFEHRRLRSPDVREAEELQRSRSVGAYAMYNVLSASTAKPNALLRDNGSSGPKCHCQNSISHDESRQWESAGTRLETPSVHKCPWAERISLKKLCSESGCRSHTSALCAIIKPEEDGATKAVSSISTL